MKLFFPIGKKSFCVTVHQRDPWTESRLTGQSRTWFALHGSSDSGTNPALLGNGWSQGAEVTSWSEAISTPS